MYKILPYSYEQSKKLKLQIHPSDNPKYKIKVYDSDGKFLFYGGYPQYSDYPHYIESHGKP